jgi:hypothetical protein
VSERASPLAQRIRDEFGELERLVERAQEGWRRAQRSSDDFYLDSVAMNLHGFYVGLERLFILVAGIIDEMQLDPAKVQRLVQQAPAALAQVRRELLAFADFLEQRSTG